MIIETFKAGKVEELYQRFEERGRMLPDRVKYINSWVDVELKTCYQVMEAPGIELIEQWTLNWADLASFQIVPVLQSDEVTRRLRKDS